MTYTGSMDLVVSHFCGEPIQVHIAWSSYMGSYENPPEYDEERVYSDSTGRKAERCIKCGVDLDLDDIFEKNVTLAAEREYARGQYMDGDEQDYEPDDGGYDDNYILPDER